MGAPAGPAAPDAPAADNPVTRLIAVLDSDGDGRLSYAEYRAVASDHHEPVDLDLNEDGALDEAEIRRMLLTVSPLLPVRGRRGTADGDTTPRQRSSLMEAIRRLHRKGRHE